MGGQVSNLIGKSPNPEVNPDSENLRRYQAEIDADGVGTSTETKGVTIDPDETSFKEGWDKRKVTWWERIFFDKRARIAYVFVLGVVLGLIIPVIIFATKLESRGKPIYGSCLIKSHARFQCLLNSEEPVTEESCTRALCCWSNANDDQPFHCYHSFPSAYQYNVSSSKTVQKKTGGGVDGGSNEMQSVDILTQTNIELRPSHADLMSPLRVITHWESTEHLVVEIFNAEVFSNRAAPLGGDDLTKQKSKPNHNPRQNENPPFTVEWSEDKEYFFLRIARRETDETIFDTRLGPVYTSKKDITLATLLPTEYFYGLKGGQGSQTTQTFTTVNGFENSEFPFYISFEASGKWHGVLIDTTEPILVQVVQAPGLLFHLETDRPEMNLHFFAGPTQPQILAQLNTYIKTKYKITHSPMIPPYWGLGLHLCRKLDNSSEVLTHIQRLFMKDNSMVYDSDCIDEYLRHPVHVDEDNFSPNLTEILDLLLNRNGDGNQIKRIILSQKVTMLTKKGLVSADDQNSVFRNFLVMDISNASKQVPFLGKVGNMSVNYIDFFHTNFSSAEFPPLPKEGNETVDKPLPHHGFSLDDNFPKVDKSSELCPPSNTRLQSSFATRLETTSDDVNVTALWGTLCPLTTAHRVGNANERHMRLHNVYGEQSLKVVHRTVTKREKEPNDMLLSSSSFFIASLYYGAFNGMQVPFTWKGLQASVENTVRNYALAPISGTPICGGMMLNNVTIPQNKDLCLRWFQFGLLLPLARNSYDGHSSYGPYQLPGVYQDYLNDTIRSRYAYAPYYFTELLKYQKTLVPLVRPMSFDFSEPHERRNTLPLLTQFMIGDAIFAAPIIDRGDSRTAFFPAGRWYAMDGREVSASMNVGEWKSITGLITETPMYLRGSYMIPTLQNPVGLSIEESLQGNYTLLAGLSSNKSSIRTAYGSLTVIEPNSNNTIVHEVNFSITVNQTTKPTDWIKMVINVNATCGSKLLQISTQIDQVRVFGLTNLGNLSVTVTPSDSPQDSHSGGFMYTGEHRSLRIHSLAMDWCKSTKYEVVVETFDENDDNTTDDSMTTNDSTTDDTMTTNDNTTSDDGTTTN